MAATADLRREAGAVALERDVLVVEGPEAVGFLQGQLSQDVAALPVGASAPSLLLQPTGKVDAWLRATRTGEESVLLDVDAGWGEAVHARLRRFRLRTKADLVPARWTGWALRGPGTAEGEGLAVVGPGIEGRDRIAPDGVDLADLGLPEAPAGALEALRVEAGIPRMGAEADDATIPAELGQWLIDASVSFTKGCYTGQELVARIDSRGGNVPRPVRGLLLERSVAVGDAVRVGGAEVGRITSVAESPELGAIALGLVGRAVEPGADAEVASADGPVPARVAGLPLR